MSVEAMLASCLRDHSLPQAAYIDPTIFDADLDRIWYREWVLAGVAAAIPTLGDFERVRIGEFDLLLVRGDDGVVRALHNVCRHRGFPLCEVDSGALKRRIVCPYHQWAYALDGSLARARRMPDDFDQSAYPLGQAHCESVGGLIFICVADDPPPFAPFADLVAPYLKPYHLDHAVVAHRTVTTEQGNWKLVMENNRECFHCAVSHPQLMRSFPEAPLHAGNAAEDDIAEMERLVVDCEALGLPGRFAAAPDASYRVMRMPFLPGSSSMTLSGKAAVSKRFEGLPDREIGDVLLYHYPSSWNHFQADHAVIFRITPIAPDRTELTTYWLVPEGSEAVVDFDLDTLTEVWEATNEQDTALVARAQRGVTSPAYRPGPYSPSEEDGVMQFIAWYRDRLSRAAKSPSARC
jgi:stachydrine N-demethylase